MCILQNDFRQVRGSNKFYLLRDLSSTNPILVMSLYELPTEGLALCLRYYDIRYILRAENRLNLLTVVNGITWFRWFWNRLNYKLILARCGKDNRC